MTKPALELLPYPGLPVPYPLLNVVAALTIQHMARFWDITDFAMRQSPGTLLDIGGPYRFNCGPYSTRFHFPIDDKSLIASIRNERDGTVSYYLNYAVHPPGVGWFDIGEDAAGFIRPTSKTNFMVLWKPYSFPTDLSE